MFPSSDEKSKVERSKDELLIEAILASGVKIPPLPEVLLKLQAVLTDEEAGPRELAAVVQNDGAISGALFRLAGSPVFGLRAKVASIDKAVTVMGMKTAVATVRSAALHGALHDPQHAAALENLWARSGAIAELMMLALKCAPVRGLPNDLAYTLGLFHDCGIALLIKRFPSYVRALSNPAGWEDILRVDLECGVHHTVSGQMVARNWLLPEEVMQAIRHHHDQKFVPPSANASKLVALLQFAIHLYAQQHRQNDSDWMLGWQEVCQQRLGVSAGQMQDWEAEVLANLGD